MTEETKPLGAWVSNYHPVESTEAKRHAHLYDQGPPKGTPMFTAEALAARGWVGLYERPPSSEGLEGGFVSQGQ